MPVAALCSLVSLKPQGFRISSMPEQIFSSWQHFSPFLGIFFLCFARWLAISIVLPVFGAELLPSIARIALSLALGLISSLVLIAKTTAPNILDNNIHFIFLLLKEFALGFILGFLMALIFYCFEIAGQIMDLARGASMAKMLVPETKIQSSPLGSFFFQLSVVIFIGLGFHRELIHNIFDSFLLFPPQKLALALTKDQSISFFNLVTQILSTLFGLAVRFALPIGFICFVVDLSFGLLNRAAPQINAYFLSLPAKIILGLVLCFFCLIYFLEIFLSINLEFKNIFNWLFY